MFDSFNEIYQSLISNEVSRSETFIKASELFRLKFGHTPYADWNSFKSSRSQKQLNWYPNGRKRKNNGCGYIYIMKLCKTKYFKIGYSINVSTRLSQIRTSCCPFDVDLIFKKYFTNASDVESALHESFKHKRFKKEWFTLSKDDIKKIKDGYFFTS